MSYQVGREKGQHRNRRCKPSGHSLIINPSSVRNSSSVLATYTVSAFEQLLSLIVTTNLSKYFYLYLLMKKRRHRKISPKFLQVMHLRNA